MTTYTAITSGQRDAESPIDVTLIGLMIDNPVAITEGASGAPKTQTAGITDLAVTEAKLAASAVSQGKLKTTESSVYTTNTAITLLTLPGGAYGFYPRIWADVGNATLRSVLIGGDQHFDGNGLGTTALTRVAIASDGSTATSATQRYIQASPPYDLGDGDIPLFIFAVMTPLGKIESAYIAPEAPWHNNGPTSIRPDIVIDGRKFQRRKQRIVESGFGSVRAALAAASGNKARADLMNYLATDKMVDVEITQAIKQADMPLIPHPFLGNNLTGKTVVLLDPVSPLIHQLFDIHESGESVAEIVRDWLTIGNTALPRSGPPGVMVVGAALK